MQIMRYSLHFTSCFLLICAVHQCFDWLIALNRRRNQYEKTNPIRVVSSGNATRIIVNSRICGG